MTGTKKTELSVPVVRKNDYKVDEKIGLSALHAPNAKYSPEQKLTAMMTFVTTGSMPAAARAAGVPKWVPYNWRDGSNWWSEQVALIRKEKQEEVDGLMTQIIHRNLDTLGEMSSSGMEKRVDKDGKIVDKPISFRDLTVNTAVLYDKRALLRGEPTSRSDSGTTERTLERLREYFEEIADEIGKRKTERVIDGEFKSDD